MVVVSVLLVVAALFIGIDGFRAFFNYFGKPVSSARTAPAKSQA
jgi:hypothetical protein